MHNIVVELNLNIKMNPRKEISIPSKKMSLFFIWFSILNIITFHDFGTIMIVVTLPISYFFIYLSTLYQISIDQEHFYISSLFHKSEILEINCFESFKKSRFFFVKIYVLKFSTGKSYKFMSIPKFMYSYNFDIESFLNKLLKN